MFICYANVSLKESRHPSSWCVADLLLSEAHPVHCKWENGGRWVLRCQTCCSCWIISWRTSATYLLFLPLPFLCLILTLCDFPSFFSWFGFFGLVSTILTSFLEWNLWSDFILSCGKMVCIICGILLKIHTVSILFKTWFWNMEF